MVRCPCGALVGHVTREPGLPAEGPPVKPNPRRLAEIREFLARPFPGPSKKWARDLVARHAAGEHLAPIQIEMAKAALGQQTDHRKREPGEDWEEDSPL